MTLGAGTARPVRLQPDRQDWIFRESDCGHHQKQTLIDDPWLSSRRHRVPVRPRGADDYLDRINGGRSARTGSAGKGDRIALPW